MLLPTMLPMAISALAWMAANILTTSYGVDVPKATMVRPTTRSLTLRIRAMEDDPSTRKSAPLISSAKPTISNPYVSISVSEYIRIAAKFNAKRRSSTNADL